MKRIVIYRNSMKLSGGVERVIANLSSEWTKKYEVHLVVKDDATSFYTLSNKIIVHTIDAPFQYNMNNRFQRICQTFQTFVKSRKKLKKVIEQLDADYIYCTTPLNAMELFSLGKKYRTKIVVSEHGSYYGYNKVYTAIKKYIYPKIYCVSVPNRMDTEIYTAWNCNAIYIPHVVTYSGLERNNLESKIVLNVGRLTSDKQQQLLIECWAKIDDYKGWKLLIVGDGEERERIENAIRFFKVEDSVMLMDATKEIKDIYRKASVFAFSSRCEGFGMVLLEAMAFGIPCISFDCPSGPRDVVISGKNGFLIEAYDKQKFMEALKTCINLNHVDLLKLGEGAYDTVQGWDNGAILQKWDEVFK